MRRVKINIPRTVITTPVTKIAVPPIVPQVLSQGGSYPTSSIPQQNGTIGAYLTQTIPPTPITTPSSLPLNLTLTTPTEFGVSFDLVSAVPALITFLNGLITGLNTYATAMQTFLNTLLNTILIGFLSTVISVFQIIADVSATVSLYTILLSLTGNLSLLNSNVVLPLVNGLVPYTGAIGANVGSLTAASATFLNVLAPLPALITGIIPSQTAIITELEQGQTSISNYTTTLQNLLTTAQGLTIPTLTLPTIPTTLPVNFTLTIPTGTMFNFGSEAFPALSTPALTVPSLTGVPVILPNIPAGIVTLPDVNLCSLQFQRPIIIPENDICTPAVCANGVIVDEHC